VSFAAGGFGEAFVPATLMASADAAATAKSILASESLFRLGFAGYLVEAVCDVTLALLLYVLLRPVHRNLALLAAFFGLVATATFATAELFYWGALLILRGAGHLKAFSPEQRESLALLSLDAYGAGGGLFMVFYGVASILRGCLIFRSGYLPRFLGVLLALTGLAFVARNFALILAPAYASPLLLLPAVLTGLLLGLWLAVRGVDVPKWNQRAVLEGGGGAKATVVS
jgi:hypothetical protein